MTWRESVSVFDGEKELELIWYPARDSMSSPLTRGPYGSQRVYSPPSLYVQSPMADKDVVNFSPDNIACIFCFPGCYCFPSS